MFQNLETLYIILLSSQILSNQHGQNTCIATATNFRSLSY